MRSCRERVEIVLTTNLHAVNEWELKWGSEGGGGQLIPAKDFILKVLKLHADGQRNVVSVANNKVWHLSEE